MEKEKNEGEGLFLFYQTGAREELQSVGGIVFRKKLADGVGKLSGDLVELNKLSEGLTLSHDPLVLFFSEHEVGSTTIPPQNSSQLPSCQEDTCTFFFKH